MENVDVDTKGNGSLELACMVYKGVYRCLFFCFEE